MATYVRKIIFICVPVAVVALMALLIVRNRESIIQFPWRLHLGYLGLALGFHSLALWATFWAWHLMIKRFSGFADRRANIRFYFVSTLAKRIPTSLPYIGGRLFLYRQVGVSGAVVLNCVLLENLLLGVAGILVFVVFLPAYTIPISVGVIYGLILLVCLLIAVLALRTSIAGDFINLVLRRLGKAGLNEIPSRAELLAWVGIYVLPWLFAALSLYYGILGFSEYSALSIQDALAISTLATVVALLNLVIPTGLGLKELTLAALLAPWMPLSAALVVSLLYRLLHTLNEVLWACLALFVSVDTEALSIPAAHGSEPI